MARVSSHAYKLPVTCTDLTGQPFRCRRPPALMGRRCYASPASHFGKNAVGHRERAGRSPRTKYVGETTVFLYGQRPMRSHLHELLTYRATVPCRVHKEDSAKYVPSTVPCRQSAYRDRNQTVQVL